MFSYNRWPGDRWTLSFQFENNAKATREKYMDHPKETGRFRGQSIRIAYAISCAFFICASWYFHDDIIRPQKNLDNFSYVGTVGTLIALLIAVCEVVHSLKVSQSIQREARALLFHVKSVENASSFSDCLSALDDVTANINVEDYKSALKSFLFFRKVCVKVVPGYGADENGGVALNDLGQVELTLHKAHHTSASAPFSKRQKTDLINKVLLIKQDIEMLNPAKGEVYAAS